jgi:signal transduction histidine kinase/tetratricopeptide (TPR) repeat protein
MSVTIKTALKRQKRLLLLFVLTILLPSAILAFFAVIAIRNESYRLAKQVENEYRAAAESLEAQISKCLSEAELTLQSLARQEHFAQRRYAGMRRAWADMVTANPLIEQVFTSYSDEEPFFPLLETVPGSSMPTSPAPLPLALAGLLRQAQKHEFEEADCNRAVAMHEKIGALTRDRNIKAQMLANAGRCLMKLGQIDRALSRYREVSDGFSDCVSAHGIPMELLARLQMAECNRMKGDRTGAAEESLHLYKDLLQKPWPMNRDRFETYSSGVEETLSEWISSASAGSGGAEFAREFASLQAQHRVRRDAFRVASLLRDDIIPALWEVAKMSDPGRLSPVRYSHPLPQKTLLLIAAMIPDSAGRTSMGMAGAVISNQRLEEGVLGESIARLQFSAPARLVVSSLSGELIHGTRGEGAATVTLVFKKGFPPWKIEFFRLQPQISTVLQLSKSIYFWSIPVLVLILITGAVLTARTIAHQIQVLDLQSDLVSSVSHEFKTPLASMNALLERLREGKVREGEKAGRYFSIMSADVDRLTRMVNNILSAARTEDGKAVYNRIDTEMRSWLLDQMKALEYNHRDSGIKLQVQIAEDLPPLCIDPDAISLALSNLFDNAVKFSPEKKEICFRARREGEDVILEIEDSGIGIPPDELDKVFDKFYRGRNALKLSVRGLGLGLATAKHIIEDHGGRLAVESKVDAGTRFRIAMPIDSKGGHHVQETAHH